MDSSLMGPLAVAAVLVIRTALVEIRHTGSARQQWSFLTSRRAMATGTVAALLLSASGWQAAGFAGVAWAVLAGALVAYLVNVSNQPDQPEDERGAERDGGRR